jgi:hypothetical protein
MKIKISSVWNSLYSKLLQEKDINGLYTKKKKNYSDTWERQQYGNFLEEERNMYRQNSLKPHP